MKVGIVGAGISGLSAARELKRLGHQVVILEKSKAVGGRVATRWYGEFRFDTGASSFCPKQSVLSKVLTEELDRSELVEIEKPIFVHTGLRVSAGDAARNAPRYTYISGNNTLAKLLSEGIQIRQNTEVTRLVQQGTGFELCDEQFDAVILTCPVPQTSQLLYTLDENRPIAHVRYRPCLSVLLGFEKTFDRDLPYHALIDLEQRHPLLWLSIESLKSPKRAPEGGTSFVVQMSGPYSQSQYSTADSEIIDAVLDYLARIYGDGWRKPVVADVKRWKYSQPENIASLETVNNFGRQNLIVIGDGLIGSRVEHAYDSGLWAAAKLDAMDKRP